MSKPIQTVEELDAVLHWRGKHAQAIKERDALQLSLTTADERADLLGTEVARLNRVKLALKELVESHAGNLSVYRYHLSEALAMAEKVRDASLGMQRKCLADLIDYLHQSGAALKPAKSDGDSSTCTWQHVDDRGIWDTGCGTSWAFTDEGPKENGMKFCHACGKTLMVEDSGDDD